MVTVLEQLIAPASFCRGGYLIADFLLTSYCSLKRWICARRFRLPRRSWFAPRSRLAQHSQAMEWCAPRFNCFSSLGTRWGRRAQWLVTLSVFYKTSIISNCEDSELHEKYRPGSLEISFILFILSKVLISEFEQESRVRSKQACFLQFIRELIGRQQQSSSFSAYQEPVLLSRDFNKPIRSQNCSHVTWKASQSEVCRVFQSVW